MVAGTILTLRNRRGSNEIALCTRTVNHALDTETIYRYAPNYIRAANFYFSKRYFVYNIDLFFRPLFSRPVALMSLCTSLTVERAEAFANNAVKFPGTRGDRGLNNV